LKAYREKTRTAPIMNGMAASLNDDDIANLAAYFSRLKACE
jgi:cytochrome c553